MDRAKELPPLHTAVTTDTLHDIMSSGQVPEHLLSLPEATVRASAFVAAIAVGRQYFPPRSTMDIMSQADPILSNAFKGTEPAE